MLWGAFGNGNHYVFRVATIVVIITDTPKQVLRAVAGYAGTFPIILSYGIVHSLFAGLVSHFFSVTSPILCDGISQ